jgi:formylglycine-generating enzyme required for sulfatase activity
MKLPRFWLYLLLVFVCALAISGCGTLAEANPEAGAAAGGGQEKESLPAKAVEERESEVFSLPGLGSHFVFALPDPVIRWNPQARSSRIQVQVSTSEDFAEGTILFDAETPDDFIELKLGLSEDALRFLRARRLSPAGTAEPWTPVVAISYKPLSLNMRTIVPPGQSPGFVMGASSGKPREQPEHRVVLDQACEMAVHEMTNGLLAEILNRLLPGGEIEIGDGVIKGKDGFPYLGLGFLNYGFQFGLELRTGEDTSAPRVVPKEGRAGHPAVGLSWYGAAFVCDSLSRMFGHKPAYGILSPGLTADSGTAGFRLPRESEWEYAARGSDSHLYPGGAPDLDSRTANFLRSGDPFETRLEDPAAAGGPTTPVGFYDGEVKNAYKTMNGASHSGLHDLLGNVWEWCDDFFDPESYARASEEENAASGKDRFRVVRGGAWNTPRPDVSFTSRGWYKAEGLSYSLGMRLARTLEEETGESIREDIP